MGNCHRLLSTSTSDSESYISQELVGSTQQRSSKQNSLFIALYLFVAFPSTVLNEEMTSMTRPYTTLNADGSTYFKIHHNYYPRTQLQNFLQFGTFKPKWLIINEEDSEVNNDEGGESFLPESASKPANNVFIQNPSRIIVGRRAERGDERQQLVDKLHPSQPHHQRIGRRNGMMGGGLLADKQLQIRNINDIGWFRFG